MRQILTNRLLAALIPGLLLASGAIAEEQDFKSSKDLIPQLQAPGSDEVRARGIAPVESDSAQGSVANDPGAAGRVDLRIPFEFDSARLTRRGARQLDELAIALADKSLSRYNFQLLGHTDAYGRAGYNQRLSDRRAQAVKDYLVRKHGIAPQRIETMGFGEDNPRNPDDPYAPENRRVEVINLGEY